MYYIANKKNSQDDVPYIVVYVNQFIYLVITARNTSAMKDINTKSACETLRPCKRKGKENPIIKGNSLVGDEGYP